MANEGPTTYRELADVLRQQIASGQYGPGATLPKATELAETYGLSRQTAQRAMTVLAGEGLVRTIRGTGAVVQARGRRRRIQRGQAVTRNPHYGYVFPAAASASEQWQTHGSPYRSHESAPSVVAEAFGVEVGSEVLRRRRVTSPEGEPPFQIVDTWISPEGVADAPQVAEPSTGPGGYLDRLEEAGHGPVSWRETARTRMPTKEEASLLQISTALPVFELVLEENSARTEQPVAVTIRVIPGDRVELVTELLRAESAEWPVEPIH